MFKVHVKRGAGGGGGEGDGGSVKRDALDGTRDT